jgi:hypothetical protein
VGLTLDDDAPAAIPESTCSSGAPTGSWRPTNYDTAENFPGVTGPYPVGLGNFRGTSPNGLWQLYVLDDGGGGEAISVGGGWSLELTTTGAPATAHKKKCRKHKKRSASAGKKRCKKKRR